MRPHPGLHATAACIAHHPPAHPLAGPQAVAEGLYSVDGMDLDHYRHHEQLQHGDLNWVVPGKLLAFR